MSERDIYMHDIKVVFGKLKYQSYDELSDVDRTILSFAFSKKYSDVEIKYMLEELSEKLSINLCLRRNKLEEY
ncbi:hypothetical protein BUY98_08905 [Staphylococcus gallinarum]|uniref:hypothetical protein n=1 Tax=Staphylococcus gallinarum TaxID=1293 RepID=UPI000E6868E8|nr:hypothetical protein [Staphylococcus gallinarum]RIL33038.1 hypothetical protein BUY98_08905 [Staphylococcus gallinarum]